MGRPTGVTILGILHAIFGAIAIVAAIGGFTALTVGIFSDASIAGAGLFLLVLAGVVAAINFGIAGALFSGKSWGRTIVIILAGISLAIGIFTIVSGDASVVISIILNAIILWYMRLSHVKNYFEGTPERESY